MAVEQRDAGIPVQAAACGGIAQADYSGELLGSLRHESLADQLQLHRRAPDADRYR